MPRDYKHSARKPAAKRKPLPGWLWFLAGVASAGALFALYSLGVVSPGRVSELVSEATSKVSRPERTVRDKPRAGAEKDKPRFEFYTMLPEMEVAVPDHVLELEAGGETPSANDASASYIVQVGSFRKAEQADRLKAELAFLGLEAKVQTVSINGEDTWHRVRLGPYRDVKVLNEARARLSANRIESMVLKVKQ